MRTKFRIKERVFIQENVAFIHLSIYQLQNQFLQAMKNDEN